MRELQLEGCKPALTNGETIEALYTGPFEKVEAGGVVMSRGRRVRVPASVADQLRGTKSGFVLFDHPAGHAKHTADCGS